MIDLRNEEPVSTGPTTRSLVWVKTENGWTQEPRHVAVKRTGPVQPLETKQQWAPSVSYAIELLKRMSPRDRMQVLDAFEKTAD